MSKIIIPIALVFFCQGLKAQSFFGPINNIIENVFSPPPKRYLKLIQELKLEKELSLSKKSKKLEKVIEKLNGYVKDNAEGAYELAPHIGLAMAMHDLAQLSGNQTQNLCAEAEKKWNKALEIIKKSENRKDLELLEFFFKKYYPSVKFSSVYKVDGIKWIEEQMQIAQSCTETPQGNKFCCSSQDEKAKKAYRRDLRKFQKDVFESYFSRTEDEKKINKLKDQYPKLFHNKGNEDARMDGQAPLTHGILKGMVFEMAAQFAPDRNKYIEYCYKSHQGWYSLFECYNNRSNRGKYEWNKIEKMLVENNQTFDSLWVASIYQQSKDCAFTIYTCADTLAINFDTLCHQKQCSPEYNCSCIYRGCTTNPKARNYVSPTKINADGSNLIIEPCKGCMDSCYTDFDPLAETPVPCIGKNICKTPLPALAGCKDTCYSDFNPLAEIAIPCKGKYNCDTTVVIRGCTDKCARKYNPLATVDDGSCIVECGCRDTTARNGSLRYTHHNQDSCKYLISSPEDLQEKLRRLIRNQRDSLKKKILSSFNISGVNNGKGASIDFDIQFNKDMFNYSVNRYGYDLGSYTNFLVVEVLQEIFDIFEGFAIGVGQDKNFVPFNTTIITGRILGEADGNKIRNGGIEYKGYGGNIINQPYTLFPSDKKPQNISDLLSLVMKGDTSISLTMGDFFGGKNDRYPNQGNIILATLRAQQLLPILEQQFGRGDIKKYIEIGSIAHPSNKKGLEYRGIFGYIEFPELFVIKSPTNPYDPNKTVKDCLCPK